MGRVSGLNGIATPSGLATGVFVTPADLFRYDAPEARQFDPMGNPSYFSIDGGATNFGNWNNAALRAGDLADWAPLQLGGNLPQTDAYGDNVMGIAQDISQNDIVLMSALGHQQQPMLASSQG